MLFDLERFDEIGKFDERFFMYYEDVDLCVRVLALGLRIEIARCGKFIHKGAYGSRKNVFLLFQHFKSFLYFLWKYR